MKRFHDHSHQNDFRPARLAIRRNVRGWFIVVVLGHVLNIFQFAAPWQIHPYYRGRTARTTPIRNFDMPYTVYTHTFSTKRVDTSGNTRLSINQRRRNTHACLIFLTLLSFCSEKGETTWKPYSRSSPLFSCEFFYIGIKFLAFSVIGLTWRTKILFFDV